MARARIVKPAVFRHEALFDMERETGMPMRVAWIGLWTVCDKAGRFPWRPRAIKPDVLPYDDVDMSAVLDAFERAGMIVRYTIDRETFGAVVSWPKHQTPNTREPASTIPPPTGTPQVVDESDSCDEPGADAHAEQRNARAEHARSSAMRAPFGIGIGIGIGNGSGNGRDALASGAREARRHERAEPTDTGAVPSALREAQEIRVGALGEAARLADDEQRRLRGYVAECAKRMALPAFLAQWRGFHADAYAVAQGCPVDLFAKSPSKYAPKPAVTFVRPVTDTSGSLVIE